LFLGSGCVMSSNLPEQPISSRDRGKSLGPTGGKTTDRRKQQFIRGKSKDYNLGPLLSDDVVYNVNERLMTQCR